MRESYYWKKFLNNFFTVWFYQRFHKWYIFKIALCYFKKCPLSTKELKIYTIHVLPNQNQFPSHKKSGILPLSLRHLNKRNNGRVFYVLTWFSFHFISCQHNKTRMNLYKILIIFISKYYLLNQGTIFQFQWRALLFFLYPVGVKEVQQK